MENRLELNKKPVYELPSDVLIGEYIYSRDIKRYREPDFEPDICIGGWGVGCFGKIYNAKEVSNQIWIKTNNNELLDFIKEHNWRIYLNNIASAFLSLTLFKKIILEEFYNKK